jgi:hypothetical protein
MRWSLVGEPGPYGLRALRWALACLVAAGLALAATSAAAPPGAHAARTCKAPRYPGSGYFTSLKVSRVSCASGRRVTLAHYRCRTRHGPAGRCRSTVLHYRCGERRNSIPTEIDARVTCRRGHRTVIYTYQQDL